MDLEDIRKLKQELEHRIRAVTAEAIEDFQVRTGLEINGVSINLGIDDAVQDGRKSVVLSCSLGVEL